MIKYGDYKDGKGTEEERKVWEESLKKNAVDCGKAVTNIWAGLNKSLDFDYTRDVLNKLPSALPTVRYPLLDPVNLAPTTGEKLWRWALGIVVILEGLNGLVDIITKTAEQLS